MDKKRVELTKQQFDLVVHNTLCARLLYPNTCISTPDIFHRSFSCFSLLGIPWNSIPRTSAGFLPAYGYDPGIFLLRWCSPFSSCTAFLEFLLSPAVSVRKILFYGISVQTQYDICNSSLYATNYLRRSFWITSLYSVVQLADRTSIFSKGSFSCPHDRYKPFLEPLAWRVVFDMQ